MRITPKSEKEIAEMNLWPANSICSFEIIPHVTFGDKVTSTCDTQSKKSGHDMIQLVVQIYNDAGDSKVLMDYLLESTAGKLRNAMIACGLLDKYESGQFYAADFVGKKGDLRIGIEVDKTGQYADKNKIIGYVVDRTPTKTNNLHPNDPSNDLNDDLPF